MTTTLSTIDNPISQVTENIFSVTPVPLEQHNRHCNIMWL
jgi:hypothetical protein|eukprot:COSAG01_NODE_625_length_14726_cov_9.023997_18_plen_40_part_00